MTMTPETYPTGTMPLPRRGWHDPHLLAGRSIALLVVLGLLIVAGALTDTIAFKSTLDLLLRQAEALSWVMAVGATCMALVAAARTGIAVAERRRLDTVYGTVAVSVAALTWLALGAAMFLVRWLETGTGAPVFGTGLFGGTAEVPGHQLHVALFFGAVYLISGACTMFEAERLHNPEYSAYRRLGKLHDRQVRRTAAAAAELNRARSTVDHHAGELEREEHRRAAAIAARKALGHEAANYARLLMAERLRDPAKTGITETGPLPVHPALSAQPPRAALPAPTSRAAPRDSR
jgi:hypothetical protein